MTPEEREHEAALRRARQRVLFVARRLEREHGTAVADLPRDLLAATLEDVLPEDERRALCIDALGSVVERIRDLTATGMSRQDAIAIASEEMEAWA